MLLPKFRQSDITNNGQGGRKVENLSNSAVDEVCVANDHTLQTSTPSSDGRRNSRLSIDHTTDLEDVTTRVACKKDVEDDIKDVEAEILHLTEKVHPALAQI